MVLRFLGDHVRQGLVRGSSFNIIFLDEFPPPQNMKKQFFTSVYPTISSGETTKVFIVSTPLGLNMFYKMWVDAEEGRNNYKTIDVENGQRFQVMTSGNKKLSRTQVKLSSLRNLSVSL